MVFVVNRKLEQLKKNNNNKFSDDVLTLNQFIKRTRLADNNISLKMQTLISDAKFRDGCVIHLTVSILNISRYFDTIRSIVLKKYRHKILFPINVSLVYSIGISNKLLH